MRTQTERHPAIDYERLRRGDQWTKEEVAKLMHVDLEDARFAFRVLQFCEIVRRELGRRGIDAPVVQRAGFVRILTDEEASEYCERDARRYLFEKAPRRLRQMQAVEVGRLPPERVAQHDAFLLKMGRALQGARLGWRDELVLKPYVSPKPPSSGLPGRI